MDVAWSAPCIDGRCYDYQGLAMASDFLFVMAYDLRSQIYDLEDCVASANSPIARVDEGLTKFTDLLRIPSSQLVLGGSFDCIPDKAYWTVISFLVPWYCYDYQCLSIDANLTCVRDQSSCDTDRKSVFFIGYCPCSISRCSMFGCCRCAT